MTSRNLRRELEAALSPFVQSVHIDAAVNAVLQGLFHETSTIPVPVDEDEIDDHWFPPRRKWHLEWVEHERWCGPWQPQEGHVCPIGCEHEERRRQLMAHTLSVPGGTVQP